MALNALSGPDLQRGEVRLAGRVGRRLAANCHTIDRKFDPSDGGTQFIMRTDRDLNRGALDDRTVYVGRQK